MAFYRDHIYPHLVTVLGDPKPIQEIRKRMIPLAQGNVLEIGVGPGVNFVHYDPAKVTKLFALEPNGGMIRMAEQRRKRTQLNIEFLDLPGEPRRALPCCLWRPLPACDFASSTISGVSGKTHVQRMSDLVGYRNRNAPRTI